MNVVEVMEGFIFGDVNIIYCNFYSIFIFEDYFYCVVIFEVYWEKLCIFSFGVLMSDFSDLLKKKRFSGFDLKKWLFKEDKKVEEVLFKEKVRDLIKGYDLFILIYFLVREKIERE